MMAGNKGKIIKRIIIIAFIVAIALVVFFVLYKKGIINFQKEEEESVIDAEIREKTNQLLVIAKNFDDDNRLIDDELISDFFGIDIGELNVSERVCSIGDMVSRADSEIRTIVIGHVPKTPRQRSSLKPPKKEKRILPDRMVIRQYGLDGTYIAQYETYDEASEKTGVQKRAMQRNIWGEKKSGGGYIWRKAPANTDQTNVDPYGT